MDAKIWLIIGGMALVTAIPRLLPYYILNKTNLSQPVRKWLKLLPTVIFASMITPPLLVEGNSLAPQAHVTDLVTVLAAGIIAYFTRNIAFSLAGAITVLLVIQYLF
ncbi:AzlD domain-containing protein [Desulfoscipio geothermicus]|uniref:Branched-chain amino acid transport protein n=1 Tax=Desulfoscipio geothermicus DSM 3669 TaxID=1121426 RepID=A0A1I6D1S5_9FIRM|nr:AzlD domain-containing protein [Desulfoscipio geothermicus]SFQ99257.1 Branched-chain amino acid transport protein [Desulfoscipio geothermicus DSM 3669]